MRSSWAAGFTSMSAEELSSFAPLESIEIPTGPTYLIAGLDTGGGALDVTPEDALPMITDAGRSPLTLAELGLVRETDRRLSCSRRLTR